MNLTKKLLKGHLIIFSFFLLCIQCSAQFIHNYPVQVPIGPFAFNPSVIQKQKINKIDVKVVDKPDGKIIVDKGASYGYRFDSLGYVTTYYYTVFDKILIEETNTAPEKDKASIEDLINYVNDTIFVDVLYDSVKRVRCKRVKTGNVFDYYYYLYDSLNRIIKETRYKQLIIILKNKYDLGPKELTSNEVIEYQQLTPTQTKKLYYNKNERIYKKGIINYDENKNVISENAELTSSWQKQEHLYSYNNRNQLTKHIYKTNENGIVTYEWNYEYDKKGDIISEKKLKNNELNLEVSYLYEDTRTLIKAEAVRDYLNHSVLLIKYKYSYYQ